jgi:hypothetical protein
MQNLGKINKTSARKPYWLLLALVLFFSGQIAAASHWHDNADVVDADCALCVLSSATSAALVPDALVIASVTLCTFIFIEITRTITRRCVRSYDSRAPPLYS